jgi:hypothetical protein
MAKRLLLVYALGNAFVYYFTIYAIALAHADNLAEIVAAECDGDRELLARVREAVVRAEYKRAPRASLMGSAPWVFLALATALSIIFCREPSKWGMECSDSGLVVTDKQT